MKRMMLMIVAVAAVAPLTVGQTDQCPGLTKIATDPVSGHKLVYNRLYRYAGETDGIAQRLGTLVLDIKLNTAPVNACGGRP